MKKILIGMIKIYQSIPGDIHNHCRFTPTCSEYTIEAINEYGSLKGTIMGFKRILRCNPFNKNYGYDPVIKEKKNEKNN